jgi:hypothetical protein
LIFVKILVDKSVPAPNRNFPPTRSGSQALP